MNYALCIVLTGCGGGEQTAVAVDSVQVAIVDVDVAHVVSVPQTRSYTANVEAFNINNISPSTSNRILTIKADVGDHVSAGQVLVTLDHAQADQLRINLEETERQYNRAVQLLQIGSGTQSAVDQLRTQLDAQRAQYRNVMDNTQLISPISGVVTARNYDPGDMTGSQPVLTIGQITPAVKVVINVNETDLAVIRKGMGVDVAFDAYPDEQFAGRITRVSPAVDVNTRTFPVEVQVNNSDSRLRPGMFARVTINIGSNDNVVVPDRAVLKQTGSNVKYVYVYSNGHVAFRQVQLGQRLDNAYELLGGINDGD
ncbi:MAG: efflux RND transporter periplasmic adaptor subunit, partial [Muribaculaceae bacterium]